MCSGPRRGGGGGGRGRGGCRRGRRGGRGRLGGGSGCGRCRRGRLLGGPRGLGVLVWVVELGGVRGRRLGIGTWGS